MASYSNRCSWPDFTDRAGRLCGGRNAYSRPGGYSPLGYEREAVFRIAWGMARVGAQRFGGTPKQHFAEALKLAWRDSGSLPLALFQGLAADMKPKRPTRETFEEGMGDLMRRARLDRGKAPQRIGGLRGREWYASGAGW